MRWFCLAVLLACSQAPTEPDPDPLDSVGSTYKRTSWRLSTGTVEGYWIWRFNDGNTGVQRISEGGTIDVQWDGTYFQLDCRGVVCGYQFERIDGWYWDYRENKREEFDLYRSWTETITFGQFGLDIGGADYRYGHP